MGRELGADATINVTQEDAVSAVRHLTKGKGVEYVLECSGAPNALNEAAQMVNRGGRICLAAFPAQPTQVDLAQLVRNNIYVFGIRGEGRNATQRENHSHAQFPAPRRTDRDQVRARADRGRDQSRRSNPAGRNGGLRW
jgi:threonine dehydrogenase-like Zn-dependent dehydrogenase